MHARLICVSNRVAAPRRSAAPGGLAVGILSALKRSGGVWFGWSGELRESIPETVQLQVRERISYATIDLPAGVFHRYYDGFSNGALWPLFHYMPSKFTFRHGDQQAYQQINEIFASQLLPLLRADDLIWIHDYHLIPLGRCLRRHGVTAPIGFFLHVPFPHIETLRVLPGYADLVRDLLACDVVGFQTQSDLDSFIAAVLHVVGTGCVVDGKEIRIGARRVKCGVFPIGVDVEQIQQQSVAAFSTDAVGRMLNSLHGRKLVAGVDRLDYSKGLPERFAAYEHFLEQYPERCRQLTYLQIAPLSRKDVPSYVDIRSALERAAGRTNGRFAETDWTPIRYLNRNFPHATLMGLLRAAHVGLVTPLRDGMNLVAKEYVAAQDPLDPGVLILSTFAGAARELAAALQINPHDPAALGHALQKALDMPLAERIERHVDMRRVLRERNIHAWADGFAGALARCQRQAAEEEVPA